MRKTKTTELAAHVGERVVLGGWLHNQRRLARMTFAILRDGDGLAQVVVRDETHRALLAELHHEAVLRIEGTVVASDQAAGGYEVVAHALEVMVAPDSPPPLDLRRPTIPAQLPTLLDHAAVALRHPPRRAVARIAAASARGFRATLDGLGFVEVHTPKVVATATESGANVFPIDWFGRPAYLAQSPQLYKQMLVGVFERVYEIGPVFRAEPHDTSRHLAEYVSMDVELGFIEDHRDVMAVLREVMAGMVASIASTEEVEHLPVVPDEIPSIGFDAAQRLIEAATGEEVVGEPDLAPAHERWLGHWAQREHGSELLFVVGYPMSKRPFYTHPSPTDPEASNSFDLLFRGLELVTGGQRLHRHEDYLAVLDDETAAGLGSYLEAFRHGMPPHGGFAIGLERWVARLTGAANIRETSLFPRDLHRLTP